jgi:hypothetical protein
MQGALDTEVIPGTPHPTLIRTMWTFFYHYSSYSFNDVESHHLVRRVSVLVFSGKRWLVAGPASERWSTEDTLR